MPRTASARVRSACSIGGLSGSAGSRCASGPTIQPGNPRWAGPERNDGRSAATSTMATAQADDGAHRRGAERRYGGPRGDARPSVAPRPTTGAAFRGRRPRAGPARGQRRRAALSRARSTPLGRRARSCWRRVRSPRAAPGRGRAASSGAPASWPPGQPSHGTSRRGLRIPTRPSTPPSATSAAAMPTPRWNAVDRRRPRRPAPPRAPRRPAGRRGRRVASVRSLASLTIRCGRGRELLAGQALVDRGAELAGDHRAEGGHGEQPGDARDGVVDARRDAGVVLVGVGQHGRGQRRHGRRQPEREEQQRRAAGRST